MANHSPKKSPDQVQLSAFLRVPSLQDLRPGSFVVERENAGSRTSPIMAISVTPRSVSDATRFTPTTPHASSKSSATPSAPSNSRFARPTPGSGRTPGSSGKPGGGGSGGSSKPPFGETPEQRVARLRAAHLAAKKAQVSRFDQVISGGRRFFDSAHKITVLGLLGLTGMYPGLPSIS